MIRYHMALLGHSQRYLLPGLAYLAFLGVLYNDDGASAALPEFAVSAGAMMVLACWLTITLVDAEDPVQGLITRVHARRLSIVVGGIVGTVLACCGVLIVVSLIWSVVTHGGVPFGELAFGAMAHIGCAGTGIAIGLPCSRLLLPRAGYSTVAAPIGLVLVLLVRWLPFVNPMLRALSSNDPAAAPLVFGLVTSSLALAASSVGVVAGVRHQS
jgi:hypothetical protein